MPNQPISPTRQTHAEWLSRTRQELYTEWVTRTGHKPGANNRTWACEIARGCRECDEHLSLPCSLLAEANEIGVFLGGSCFDQYPSAFVRLYLILLSEFVGQLEDVAKQLRIDIGKPPKDVCVWANRWAKHKLHVLVQHHPVMLYADRYGDRWARVSPKLTQLKALDRCGNQRPTKVIDLEWLCKEAGGSKPDLQAANRDAKAVIVVPPLRTFLGSTCDYFRRFIDLAPTVPDRVRAFESDHPMLRC